MIINIHQISNSGPSLYVAPFSFEISIPEIKTHMASMHCKWHEDYCEDQGHVHKP